MTKKFLLSAVALYCIQLSAFSQDADSIMLKRISDQILLNGKAYSSLRVLCKTVGQRLSGSAGMYKGEAWGLKTLQEAGADKVELQECLVPHWVRGEKEWVGFRGTSPAKTHTFSVLAIGNSIGTGAKGISAQVVEVKDFNELDAKRDLVKGKIVFYNYPFNKTLLRSAYGDAVRYRGRGASAAAKYGALAVIVRSVTGAYDENPHTGALNYNDSFPRIPAFTISTKSADRLEDLLNSGYATKELFVRSTCQMLADTVGHNVIGEIRGSEFPDQVITIGGHMDSWDPAEGASDDGTGMVQSIEVLRTLKTLGYRPKRTIRIVLFANEENGGKGSAKYADAAKQSKETYIMGMESDGGAEYPRGFVCGMTKEQYAKVASWKKYFEYLDADKFNFVEGGGGGADIGPLQKNFKTAQFGLNTTGQRYFDLHHSPIDVFENVNAQELNLGAAVMTMMVYLVDQHGL